MDIVCGTKTNHPRSFLVESVYLQLNTITSEPTICCVEQLHPGLSQEPLATSDPKDLQGGFQALDFSLQQLSLVFRRLILAGDLLKLLVV